MSRHVYSSEFFDYIDAGSRASAGIVSRLLIKEMPIGSLLDVGSGHGAWAAEWMCAGVSDVVAVDGDYVNPDQLAIPRDKFVAHDLSQPLELGRRFEMVQSLEVAEHISAEFADRFVDNLVRHGDVVLFSAAVPNQGGEHHVNEQPPEYWRALFAEQDFECFDFLRVHLRDRREVKPWYRYNTLIYANEAGQRKLAPEALQTRVDRVGEAGDLTWRLRKGIVRLLPRSAVDRIAILMARMN